MAGEQPALGNASLISVYKQRRCCGTRPACHLAEAGIPDAAYAPVLKLSVLTRSSDLSGFM